MLTRLYSYAKLTESDLSARALRHLRIFSTLVILIFPWIFIVELMDVSKPIKSNIQSGLGIATVACVITTLLNRISHLILFPDKYMDEWEIRMKKDAESFAYRFFAFGIVPGFIGLLAVWGKALEGFSFNGFDVFLALSNIVMLMCILPVTYIAWTQKPLDQ